MKKMVDHQRWFNVESTLKTNLSVWNLSWFSTLIQRWINVEDQPYISWEKGWSSTLIQRWINVDDQPYFPWKLRLILNVDSTLNQRWESTLISKWLKNGWNLVEFWFSWRMVDDQRWFNVENLICAHWEWSFLPLKCTTFLPIILPHMGKELNFLPLKYKAMGKESNFLFSLNAQVSPTWGRSQSPESKLSFSTNSSPKCKAILPHNFTNPL